MNAADEEWGEDRLIECIRLCRDRPALEMIDVLIRVRTRSSPERPANMTI